jgi:hypothetical protein
MVRVDLERLRSGIGERMSYLYPPG